MALVLTVINLAIIFLSFLLGLLGMLYGDPWSIFVVILGIVLMVLGIMAVLALARRQENMKSQVFSFGAAVVFLFVMTVAHDWALMASIPDTAAFASESRSEALTAVIIDIIFLVLGAVNLAAALMLKGHLWETGGQMPEEERDTENVIYEESDTD